ncbi:DNA mismatch repair protein Mlh3-like [Anneissia japonica]|uniref:DNA mismatch repair protein Mlh3-like n=1 Tax=Anneissia japonica TaxID=1529436 RepID=UPI001425B8A7|nr:DNA mismatch repair protein Mlh3-like [Anneissia japonica]
MEAASPGIEHLQKSIVSRLRSGIAIDSITQCIDELVTNSIDAGASCIAVRTNISILRFQVVDNGCGLTKDQLSIIGERYATSKCNELSDLERLEKFGFRGEAIASLKDLSSILEIESREKASLNTFCKIFSNSSPTQVFQKKNDRPSQGTTVTVHSLFHNLPVRQKRINESLELESIRHRLAAIALIHPKISFSLRDDSSNSIILQTRKTGSIGRSFASLFGDKKAACLKEIKYCNEDFSIEGFIGTDGHHNKSLQFMYINSRLLLKTKLHKLVNTLLSKSLIARKKLWQTSETIQSTYNQINANSPGKATDQFGIFVLNISCPLADYEITLDPRKTLVEFKEWEKIIGCCTELVNDFLFRENLTMPIDNITTEIQLKKQDDLLLPSANSDLHKDISVDRYGQAISTSSCTSTLHSLIVKRPSTFEKQQCHIKDILDSDTPISLDKPGENMKKVSLELKSNIQNDGKSSITLDVTEVCPNSDSTPGASETTESIEAEERCAGNDFTDDTDKQTATNMQMTQNRMLSVKVNGQEMVDELEFLEEDCHQNSTKSPEQTVDHMLSNSIVPCGTNLLFDRKQRMLSSESENSIVSMSLRKMSNVSDSDCSKINVTSDIHPEGFKDISYASNSNHCTSIKNDDAKLKNQYCHQCKCSHAELHRRTFHKVSGKDLLEDLEKLDADSQESMEDKNLCDDSTNFLQKRQKPSTNHLKNYTNSLQIFKKSECRTGSVQSMLAHKLKQQKEGCDTDKQRYKLAYFHQVPAVLSKTIGDKEDTMVALSSFNRNIEMQAINSTTNQVNNAKVILKPNSKSTPKEKCEDHIHDVIFDVINVRLQQGSMPSDDDSFSCENNVIVSSGHSIEDTAEDIQLSSFDSSDNEAGLDFVDLSVDAESYKIADNSENISGKPVLVENLSQCSRNSKNKCDNNAHQKDSDVLKRNFHVEEEETSFGPNSETGIEQYLLDSTIKSALDSDLTNPSLPTDNLNSSEKEPVTEKQPCEISLTSCTEFLPSPSDSSSHYQNLPDAVITENDINGWLCHYDHRLGKNVYVNKFTGNSQFVEPIQIEEDDRSDCQDGTSCSVSKDRKKRAHPFLSCNATPFLPRTKKQRQSFNPHGIAVKDVDESFAEKKSTTVSLENMVDDHLNELEVDIECKWKNPSEIIKTGSDLSSLITHWDSGAAIYAIDNSEDGLNEGFSKVRIKSSKLHPPITMTFASKEMRLIVGFHDRFKRMGLQMDCVENAVEVTSVPACFVEHDVSEMKHGRKPVTAAVVESLVNEQLTLWVETSGACATLPQTIIKVLNSQACHGAIKFGDMLDMAECQKLVDELAKCALPFQCAHGRPSIVPILDFNLMRPVPVSEVSSKPHLSKLQKSSPGRNEPD